MSRKPVAAGKSSFDLIDRESAFALIDVRPGSSFLDMACGNGRYSIAVAERVGAEGTVYAVDLWEEGIAVLDQEIQARGIGNIRTLVADVCDSLPLPSASIDACLIATVLHDLPPSDRQSALREAARLLRPDGILNVIEFKKVDWGPGPPVGKRLTAEEVEALAAGCAYVKVAGSDVGEFNYLLKFEKRP